VCASRCATGPDLLGDLEGAGIPVLGAVEHGLLVHEALRLAPDVVVAHAARIETSFTDSAARLAATAPVAFVLFTADADVETMERALASGIHAYVVNGYAPERLRPLIHLAQTRFRAEHKRRREFDELSARLEERKLLERAKGLLMRAREASEDDAFRMLRKASMRTQTRVGEVSRRVIDAARDADAVNRAGALRMLSQRVVKLRALEALELGGAENGRRMADSMARADAILDAFEGGLSRATFGDLLDAVRSAWHATRAATGGAGDARSLLELDRRAGAMLGAAERLTAALKSAASGAARHVIDTCARQRMLSQRYAKQALLMDLSADADQFAIEATRAEFEHALSVLGAAPLGRTEWRAHLDDAAVLWAELRTAALASGQREGHVALAKASESLLALFERLTEDYERDPGLLLGAWR